MPDHVAMPRNGSAKKQLTVCRGGTTSRPRGGESFAENKKIPGEKKRSPVFPNRTCATKTRESARLVRADLPQNGPRHAASHPARRQEANHANPYVRTTFCHTPACEIHAWPARCPL